MEWVTKIFYKGVYLIAYAVNWLENFIFRGELMRKHFWFRKDGNSIRLVIKNHDEFAEGVQNRIDNFKDKKDEMKYITYALEKALTGCIYIVFLRGKKSVEFWAYRGKLEFTFSIDKKNGNKKYYYSVLGLLAEMDFVSNTFVPEQVFFVKTKPYHTYKMEYSGGTKTISGRFHKMAPEAALFTMKMFEEIYKDKKSELEIRVR